MVVGETALPSQMPQPCPPKCHISAQDSRCHLVKHRRNEFVTLNHGSGKSPQTPAVALNLRCVPSSHNLLLPAWSCVTAHKAPWAQGELRSRGRDWLLGFVSLWDPGKPRARGVRSALLPPQGNSLSHGLVGSLSGGSGAQGTSIEEAADLFFLLILRADAALTADTTSRS